MTEIVAVDIGGTHARFAIAEIHGHRIHQLGEETVLRTAEHASLQTAWEAFEQKLQRPLPRAAGIAIAGPVRGDVLKLTNNPWLIRPALICEKLNVDRFTLVNDFEAIAHAVAQIDPSQLSYVCGPPNPLPDNGVITVVGPGTGLGVAILLRVDGSYHVLPTEGGHIDFAPLDSIEDRILQRMRERYRRVSIERIVSGPGLVNIHEVLAEIEGRVCGPMNDKDLWSAALSGSDSLAAAALDRFCLCLGAVAGDLALTHGPGGVVIAGGLGFRLADHLPRSGFAQRFAGKGRFETLMNGVPVKLISHPQPGLYGAAAAFAAQHGE